MQTLPRHGIRWPRDMTTGPAPVRRDRPRKEREWRMSGSRVELGVDLQGDLLADEDAACLEWGIPRDAPLLTVDLGLRGEPEDLGSPRGHADAFERGVKGERPSDAVDGEVTGQPELALADVFDAGRAERHLARILGVEKVSRAQVVVPIIRTRRDAAEPHVDSDRRG